MAVMSLTPSYSSFNPLGPKSDQHQFSPNNIHTLAREKVMRITKLIPKLKGKCFDLKPNSLNYSWKKCMEVSLENLYVDRGA